MGCAAVLDDLDLLVVKIWVGFAGDRHPLINQSHGIAVIVVPHNGTDRLLAKKEIDCISGVAVLGYDTGCKQPSQALTDITGLAGVQLVFDVPSSGYYRFYLF
jgi:hypothetical protein